MSDLVVYISISDTGTLFYRNPRCPNWKKVIFNEDEVQKILFSFHSSQSAGHRGINATLASVTQRYHWKGVREDIIDYVSIISILCAFVAKLLSCSCMISTTLLKYNLTTHIYVTY